MQVQNINNNNTSFKAKLNLLGNVKMFKPEQIVDLQNLTKNLGTPNDIVQIDISKNQEYFLKLTRKSYVLDVMTSMNEKLNHTCEIGYLGEITEWEKMDHASLLKSNIKGMPKNIQASMSPYDLAKNIIIKLIKKTKAKAS